MFKYAKVNINSNKKKTPPRKLIEKVVVFLVFHLEIYSRVNSLRITRKLLKEQFLHISKVLGKVTDIETTNIKKQRY
jgi:hypothetical protein